MFDFLFVVIMVVLFASSIVSIVLIGDLGYKHLKYVIPINLSLLILLVSWSTVARHEYHIIKKYEVYKVQTAFNRDFIVLNDDNIVNMNKRFERDFTEGDEIYYYPYQTVYGLTYGNDLFCIKPEKENDNCECE